MKKIKVAKALLPFMLLGSPALAGGSSVRSGSRTRVKKAVVQHSVKAETKIEEKKEFKNPFGVFGSSKTTMKKTKDSQNNVLAFLKEENLLLSDSTQMVTLTGDIASRKEFLGCSTSGWTTTLYLHRCGGDTTPPTLSAVGSNTIAITTANIVATSNETGTMYYVVTTSAVAPTNAQVVAGQDNTGAAAFKSANSAVTAATAKTFNVTGLSGSTQYYYYFAAKDAAANVSTVSSGTFTTLAANTAPTLGGTFTTAGAVNDNATTTPFSGVTVADVDSNPVSIAITYTAANGTLTGTGITGSAGSYTMTSAALATVQANLQGLVFHPTANQVAPASTVISTFTLTPNDGTVDGTANATTQITATSVNDIPTDIALSSASVNQSGGVNAIVGTLSNTDADTGQTYTYTLVAGTGSTDNASFNISGTNFRANDASLLAGGTYAVRLNVNDGIANFEKQFTITVVDNVTPTLSTLSPTDNATNIAVDSNLVITLNENVVIGTGDILIKTTIGDTLIETIPVGDARVTVSNAAVTINPTTTLSLNTEYYVIIPATAFTDGAANSYAGLTATTDWSFTTVADSTPPTISSVSIPNTAMKIGSVVTATITVASDSDDYTTGSGAITGTIGGFTLGSLTKTNNTTYTAQFTVTSGGTDVLSGSDIPVNFTLADSAGNTSTAYTTAIAQASDSIDANIPTLSTVTIASNNASSSKAKTGDVVTLSIVANETLSANPTVTIAGNVAAVTNPSGNNYTATYTMASGDAEGVVPFTIDFADAATNAGAQVTALTSGTGVTFDKTAPNGYSVAFTTTPLINANKSAAAFQFASAEVGATYNYSIDDTNGATTAVTGSGTIATLTDTISGINLSSLDDGTLSVSVTLTDPTGNVGSGATNTVTKDATLPTITTATMASNNTDTTKAKVGDTITITFTTSEIVALPTATIAGQAATVINTSGNNYTATYTLLSGDTTGSVAFTIDMTDSAGNSATQVTALTSGIAVVFDKTAPTLSTLSPTDNATNIAVDSNLVITLNENVVIGTGDILIKTTIGDTLIETIPVGDARVTVSNAAVTINPTTTLSLNTEYYVIIPATAFTDGAANSYAGLTATTDWSFTTVADSTPPTISSVSIPNTAMKIGSVVTATITVASDSDDYTTGSGAITGTIGGFTLGSLTKTNNTTYTAQFTVTSGGTDVLSGSDIPVNFTLADSAGNTSTAYTTAIAQASDSIDANIPTLSTVTIASNNASSSKAKTGDVVTLSIVANETLSANPTVTIAGNVAAVTNPSGNNYTATYTMASGDAEGVVPFTIDFADAATNAGAQVTALTSGTGVTFDKTAPTTTISTIGISADTGASATDFTTGTASQTITATLSTTLAAGEILYGSVDGGSTYSDVSAKVAVTVISWDGATLNGTSSIKFKVTDAAGNDGTVATQAYVLDTTKPTIAITTNNNALKDADVATITFTLSEASTDFTFADVTAVGGTLSNFTATSATVYTASFTPTAGSTTGATIDVAADMFTDAVGNTNSVATQLSMSVDTTKPTIAITTNNNALKDADVATITFTLSEASTDFTFADVTAVGGTLSNFTATSATVYTASFTPTAGSTTGATIDVAADTFTDAVGNTNSAATQLSMATIDEAPVLVTVSNLSAQDEEFSDFNITLQASDAEGDAYSFSATSNDVSKSTVNVVGNQLVVSSVANANGNVSINVIVTQDNNASLVDGQTITFNINPVNDAPTIDTTFSDITLLEDNLTTNYELNVSDIEGSDLNITVDSNDTAILQVTQNWTNLVQQATWANQALDFNLTTVANANGIVRITITADDSDKNSTRSFDVNVTAVNDAPTSDDLNITINEDTTKTFSNSDFTFTDVDAGATLSSISITTLPTAGTLQLNNVDVTLNQTISTSNIVNLLFTPAANANGTPYATFGFTVNDGDANSTSVYTASINVAAVDDAPILGTITNQSITEDGTDLNITLSATDIEGDTITYTTSSSNTSIATVSIVNGKLVVSPIANANGTITVDVNATANGQSSIQTFDLSITAVNDAPTIDTTFSDITLLKENLTTNYELNVSDIEGSDLNITVDSNDTAILQVTQNWTNLVQQATWANQALDFNLTTVANANGIVRITITADDSDKNSTRSFDVTVLDGTPDPISFTPKINQALSSVIDSQSVAIRGIAYALPISIINGEYKIGNGAWLSTAGVINNDENVTLRQTSSSSYATTTTTTLTVGDINASFDVTTLADPTPTVSSTQLVTSSADSVATGVTASSGGAGSDVSPYEITYDDGSGTPSRVTINNIPGKTITFVPSSVASEYRLDNAVASYNNNATVEHLVTVGTKETKAISELSKAEVQFTADGGVETTLTNGGESIAVKANADGTAEHLVTVNGVTTKATSNVVGATTMIKTNGNVETAAPTTQADEIIGSDTWVHEALVKTDANGKTVTTFQKRNTTTDEVTDAKNTFDPQTPYNAGSTVVIEEINGKTYIKTTAEVTTNLSVE